MRRIKDHSIDMTPLLDVVFILLFALIMNVSISKAEDREIIEAQQSVNQTLKEEVEQLKVEVEALNLDDEATKVLNESLTDLVENQATMLKEKQEQLDEIAEIIKQLISNELTTTQNQQSAIILAQMLKKGDLAEALLKYQQIADKYLFINVMIGNDRGRIYVDDIYTKINIDMYDVIDAGVKEEKVEALSRYLYNWLDHKEGGYSFVFVTVTSEDKVSRAAINLIFEGLGRLQPSFDKDYYMINKYVTYN